MIRSRRTDAVSGFTLVELAVVLVIIGLIVGGLIRPLASQMEQARRADAEKALQQIHEALLGYAIVGQRLPCPDTDGDGRADACTGSSGAVNVGGLPWADLGAPREDPWGNAWIYAVNGAFTSAPVGYTTSGSGSGRIAVHEAAGCSGTQRVDDVPALVLSGAQTRNSNALENENRDGDRCFVALPYTTAGGGAFDDLVEWLSRPELLARLAAAGRL